MAIDEQAARQLFTEVLPHNRALGFEWVKLEAAAAVTRVPYRDELVGDPKRGVLHGGVITTLLDATGGIAVLAAIGQATPMATLDLRIDYLRPAPPGKDVFARVECYRLTNQVAFARGSAYVEDPHTPIAAATGTYMLHTRSGEAPQMGIRP